ncbi:hypothetical protein [Microtetraspora malaysiensis]|uniref:Uncharacterized protein n=1 Tax=Microtetraspora malaysiensis TaxID=161358 RepID=A0ABW6SKM8_9ACTN
MNFTTTPTKEAAMSASANFTRTLRGNFGQDAVELDREEREFLGETLASGNSEALLSVLDWAFRAGETGAVRTGTEHIAEALAGPLAGGNRKVMFNVLDWAFQAGEDAADNVR